MSLNLKSKTLKFSISGMRGLVPEDLNPDNIPGIIHSFSKSLTSKGIAVARDTRLSGESILQLSIASLLASGRNVFNLGIVPTPTIKAYSKVNNLGGALMVSASHNPDHYNAFKFIAKQGLFFSDKENNKLRSYLNQPLQWASHNQHGILSKSDEHNRANQLHIKAILDALPRNNKSKNNKRIKVAFDPVGACGCEIIPLLLQRLNVDVIAIHAEFSSKFARKPEPVASALTKLRKVVVENNCDFGIAVDPDADRLALVDNLGRAIGEELTLPLVLLEALNHIQSSVVVNLSSSWLNQYVSSQFNRKLYRSKVGEANVVEQMFAKKCLIGGEGNGGIIDLNVPSLGRDSLTGIAWIIALLRNKNQTLSSIVDSLPKRKMSKQTIQVSEKGLANKFSSISKRFSHFTKNTSDGLHLSHKSGLPWLHLRASNTEPVVRLIAEAENQKQLNQVLNNLK